MQKLYTLNEQLKGGLNITSAKPHIKVDEPLTFQKEFMLSSSHLATQ